MAIVDMDLWSRWTKKTLFDLEVKGQGPMKVIMVRDTPSYGHAPHTKYIDLSRKTKNVMARTRKYYLKTIIWPSCQRSRSNEGHYGMRHTVLWTSTHIPNIIDLSRKKQLFDLEVKGQGPTKVITVRDTPPYGHAPTYQISLTYLKRNNYLTLRSKSNNIYLLTGYERIASLLSLRHWLLTSASPRSIVRVEGTTNLLFPNTQSISILLYQKTLDS